MPRPGFASALLLLLLPAAAARAEVVDSAPNGFTVQNTVLVAAPPAEVYRRLVEDVGRWWHPEHTWSGKPENLTLDARPGGCFCEALDGGGGARHMEVVYAEPGKSLRMSGGLGPLQRVGISGSLGFSLEPEGTGTKLTLTYAVGGYEPGGLNQWAGAVDSVLATQLERLKTFAETGTPAPEPTKSG